MSKVKRGFAGSLWDFLCALKLSIFLLIVLAATSVIGTIIPQAPSIPKEYLQTLSPVKIKLYETLGFFDMYHSWWFLLLLYLLTINLIACSVKRLPRVWKTISEPVLTMDHSFEKSLANSCDLKLTGDAASLKNKLVSFLAAEFANPQVTEVDGDYHLFAQKHPYCRLGVYVVHTSIIIIFIGAIIGSVFGYKAFVQIVEGTGTSKVYTYKGAEKELGFTVRCEKFSVAFYDTGAPKEFKSLLSVVDGGKTVIDSKPVIVNDPLSYKGITFYQSSYGSAGDALIYLSVRNKSGGSPARIIARQGERIPLPDGSFMRVMEHTHDVKPYMPQYYGPATRLEITPQKGEPYYAILLNKFPDFDLQRGGDLVLTYDGDEEKMYTGLQVAKDPGVWVVWFGCTLMVVGICMAFFMSHRRIWVRISDNRVAIGGNASKNPAAFQRDFDELTDKLKTL